MTIERSSPEYAELLGQAIVALSYSMCGVEPGENPPPGGVIQGYDKLANEYMKVTENRDGPGPNERKHYSSCGDQLHAILERVGVRLPFVNRSSLRGKFAYGENITRLQKPACIFAKSPPVSHTYRPVPGTLCLIWTSGLDAHALVVLGKGSDDNHILTGNYGAGGMSEATAPGADVADSPCEWSESRGSLLIGGSRRGLRSIITPESIVPYIDAQINLSGTHITGEVVDALGAKYE